MSEPARKKPRITEDIRTLGRIIQNSNAGPNTPKQREISTRSTPATRNRIVVRTPGSAAAGAATPTGRTPTATSASRTSVRRRAAPTTPHAVRALQQRRNAVLASGGNRRRQSGRQQQRETPRDDLRALSRVLAKSTAPTRDSIDGGSRRRTRRSSLLDEFAGDDSPALGAAPRISLSARDLADEGEDSWHEQAPGVSYNLDADDDVTEMEIRRRAALQRRSIGDQSMLDPSFADAGEEDLDALAGMDRDDAVARRQLLEQDMTLRFVEEDDGDGQTGELRAMLGQGPGSDAGELGDATEITDGEPTFLFNIPERSRLSLAASVPRTPDGGFDDADNAADDDAPNAGDEYEAVEEDEDIADEAPLQLRETSLPLSDHNVDNLEERRHALNQARHMRLPKQMNLSRHNIEYPSFPPAVLKRLGSQFAKQYGGSGKLSKEVLRELGQASDWFFEQVAEDLGDYATHAGRKGIVESDVGLLMARQRLLDRNTTLFSLAAKHLPRELLQEVRMPMATGKKARGKRKRQALGTIDEDGDEDENS